MYTKERKIELKTELLTELKESGLSNNMFAVERLKFSNGSKLSHVINKWNVAGMVGEETWQIIENYLVSKRGYKIIATKNLVKIWNVCERAYEYKKTMVVSGDGGYGKTTALIKFKEKVEKEGQFKVYYFDASMVKTRKQFVVELMNLLNCHKAGAMNKQIPLIRDAVKKQKCLVIIDEVSSLEGKNVTILKDIMTAFKDVCGMVLAGTTYFVNNINKGASSDKHLFSETKDRIFMLPETLNAPEDSEAEAIFKANGIQGKALDVVMGRVAKHIKKSYKAKPTFRGIADCITTMKIISSENKIKVKPLSIV